MCVCVGQLLKSRCAKKAKARLKHFCSLLSDNGATNSAAAAAVADCVGEVREKERDRERERASEPGSAERKGERCGKSEQVASTGIGGKQSSLTLLQTLPPMRRGFNLVEFLCATKTQNKQVPAPLPHLRSPPSVVWHSALKLCLNWLKIISIICLA